VETIGTGGGDMATAWHSTGAPAVDLLFEASAALRRVARMPAPYGSAPVRGLLTRRIDRMARGASAAHGRSPRDGMRRAPRCRADGEAGLHP